MGSFRFKLKPSLLPFNFSVLTWSTVFAAFDCWTLALASSFMPLDRWSHEMHVWKLKTRNRPRVARESGKGMKVLKQVKWTHFDAYLLQNIATEKTSQVITSFTILGRSGRPKRLHSVATPSVIVWSYLYNFNFRSRLLESNAQFSYQGKDDKCSGEAWKS